MVAAWASLFWGQSNSAPPLPAGTMQAKVTAACTECHESRIILQQRLNKAAWSKEVDKMIKWGAVVEPADRDGFIDYLSRNFPPDRLPYQAPRMKR
jgi:hypothetical protein